MRTKNIFPDYVTKVLRLYNEKGFKAYVVGGAARDIIMGRIPDDYDVASNASPEEGITILNEAGIKTIDTSKKHGTIVAHLDGENIEITTFRVEGTYEDHRHPSSVTLSRNIEDDVARRDFTMNAIYIDPKGEPVDLFGGVNDINDKVIRAVGDPQERFTEDALRILRALRFSAVLGFKIEEKTSEAIFKTTDLLNEISEERIAEEFRKLITGKNASNIIREYTDVFGIFIPEIMRMKGFDQKSTYHDMDLLEHTLSVLDLIEPKDTNLCIAALLHDIGKPDVFKIDEQGIGHMKLHNIESRKISEVFLDKYKFSNEEKKDILDLVYLHDVFPKTKPKIRRYLSEYSVEFMERLAILQKADILSHSAKGRERMVLLEDRQKLIEEIIRDNDCFKMKDLKIGGRDLMDLGVEEGRRVGEILKDVFDKVLEGELPNDRDELILYVKSIL